MLKTNVNNDYSVLIGGEYWAFNHTAGLRTGIGVGTNEYYNIALGLSWQMVIIKTVVSGIDYSYNFNPVSALDTGKHQVSLSLKF